MRHDPIQAVGCDLDNTLLELDPAFVPAYLEALEETLGETLRRRDPAYRGRLREDILAAARRVMAVRLPLRPLAAVFYGDLQRRTGLRREDLEPAVEAFLRERASAFAGFIRPRPGALEALERVRQRGLKVALLTHPVFPRPLIEWRLQQGGLDRFPFDWVTSLEVCRASKPQPAYYRQAARVLGVPARRWLMVGDDWDNDVAPARRAGMQVLWVGAQPAPGLRRHGEGTWVGRVQDLPRLLDRLA
ncbi:MAG: HAD family hydrolase [Firmicutes bacterium]|nr:HAD family hydrolase [Bacillota bacterium]